jgi:F-type H+-transporting ATPase subunit epsilon
MEGQLFKLVIATPESVIFDGEVVELVLRAAGGDIAFLANHGPFVGEVEICIAKLVDGQGQEEQLVIDGGVVRAGSNSVILLANGAEFAKNIEQESLRRRRERLEAKLEEREDSQAEAELKSLELRASLVG